MFAPPGLARLFRSADEAEADQYMFYRLRPGVTRGGAADAASLVVPRAALDQKPPRITGRIGPFENLAGRIHQPKRAGAGWKMADRERIEGAKVVTVETRRVERIAPWKAPAIAAPCRLFPFERARQAPGFSAPPTEPGGISARIMM